MCVLDFWTEVRLLAQAENVKETLTCVANIRNSTVEKRRLQMTLTESFVWSVCRRAGLRVFLRKLVVRKTCLVYISETNTGLEVLFRSAEFDLTRNQVWMNETHWASIASRAINNCAKYCCTYSVRHELQEGNYCHNPQNGKHCFAPKKKFIKMNLCENNSKLQSASFWMDFEPHFSSEITAWASL